MSLRKKLAEAGFESNTNYEFALTCALDGEPNGLRMIVLEGDTGRRKTAFANALADALGFEQKVYHDFSLPEPPPPAHVTHDPDDPQPSTPVPTFERAISEACAYSESVKTLLILDQLQTADFPIQLKLHCFLQTGQWEAPDGVAIAYPKNTLIAVISEEHVYPPIAKLGFRIHIDAGHGNMTYRPEDFGLLSDANELFQCLAKVFETLEMTPTVSEFRQLLHDILQRVFSADSMQQAMFGRMEGLPFERLQHPEVKHAMQQAIAALEVYRGVEHTDIG